MWTASRRRTPASTNLLSADPTGPNHRSKSTGLDQQ
uniref:Uncharacterized protein n=1 Tax=Arundo donax TaxID=35708 RepID=A0A0A9B305_ARUDO